MDYAWLTARAHTFPRLQMGILCIVSTAVLYLGKILWLTLVTLQCDRLGVRVLIIALCECTESSSSAPRLHMQIKVSSVHSPQNCISNANLGAKSSPGPLT